MTEITNIIDGKIDVCINVGEFAATIATAEFDFETMSQDIMQQVNEMAPVPRLNRWAKDLKNAVLSCNICKDASSACSIKVQMTFNTKLLIVAKSVKYFVDSLLEGMLTSLIECYLVENYNQVKNYSGQKLDKEGN